MSKKVSSAAASPESANADKAKKVCKKVSTTKSASVSKSAPAALASESAEKPSRAKKTEAVSVEEPVKSKSPRAKKSVDAPVETKPKSVTPVELESTSVRKAGRKPKANAEVQDSAASEPTLSSKASAAATDSVKEPKKVGRPPKKALSASKALDVSEVSESKPRKTAKTEVSDLPDPAIPSEKKTPAKRGPKGKSKESALKDAEPVPVDRQKDSSKSSAKARQSASSDDELSNLTESDMEELYDVQPKKRGRRSKEGRDVDYEERQDVFEMPDERIDDEEVIEEDEDFEEDEEDQDDSYDDDSSDDYDSDDSDDLEDMDDSDDLSYDDDPTPKRKARKKKSRKILSPDKKTRLLKKRLEAIHDGPCKICWGLFSPEMKKIQDFDFGDEAKARAKAAELTATKGMRYFVQKLKVPVAKK